MIPPGFDFMIAKEDGDPLYRLGIVGPNHAGAMVAKTYSFAWGHEDVLRDATFYLAWWAWTRQAPDDDEEQPPRRGEG